MSVEPYQIACIQPSVRRIQKAQKDSQIKENIARECELIDYACSSPLATNVKIAVLPEYGINMPVNTSSVSNWLDVAVSVPGEFTDILGKAAERNDVYIAANVAEVSEEWPGRFFNCSFFISPEKKILFKHWKNTNNSFVIPYTTPTDVYSEFVEKFGRKSLFPVVETPMGKIGCITCGELLSPENVRCTMFNGAEVILHCTSETVDYPNWEHLKISRAIENKVYFATANIGEFRAGKRGTGSSSAFSAIISFDGTILNRTSGPGESTVIANVDINALRLARTQPFWPAETRVKLYSKEYAAASDLFWPTDHWATDPIAGTNDTQGEFKAVLERLYKNGTFVKPEGMSAVDRILEKNKRTRREGV